MAGLDPNTTSQVIKGLEKKGLLKRAASSDGRAKNPQLTPKGTELLAQALPGLEQKDGEFFNTLLPQELEGLVRIFEKITH